MGFLALLSLPQKLMLGGGSIIVAAALSFSTVEVIKNHSIRAENAALARSIDDPKTGYIAQLAQARTNTIVCRAAVDHQNDAFAKLSAESVVNAAAAKRDYDVEHAKRTRAEVGAAVIVAHPPQGTTLNDRFLDVDRQVLGDLN